MWGWMRLPLHQSAPSLGGFHLLSYITQKKTGTLMVPALLRFLGALLVPFLHHFYISRTPVIAGRTRPKP